MVDWLVEFEGSQKPLDEIKDDTFRAAISDSRRYVEKALAADPEAFQDLKIVYSVDAETGICFALRGPPHAVNLAIDLIGPHAQISATRN